MTQYNKLNVKLSNSQLNKLKSAIKNGTEVTLNVSLNLIGSSNDETNCPHKLLLTYTQVSKIRKTLANGSSANIKFPKTQLSKMIQSGGLVSNFLDLLNPDKSLLFKSDKVFKKIVNEANKLSKKVTINDIIKIATDSKNVIKDFKNASDKVLGTGITLTDNEIKCILKVIKSLENRGILLKGTTKKITSQEGGFLNFLRPLMTAGLPLMKSVLTPLAKSLLLQLGLSEGMSSADAGIQKKIYGSGTTALIASNENMEDIMKIVKSLEELGLLISGKVKQELRVTSSNPRVTSSNPRITSLNPRVTSSNLQVTSSNPQVRRPKARVTRLKARVGRLKARVEAIKPQVRY